VTGSRRDHQRLRLYGQQVVLLHQPLHSLVIDQHAAAAQFFAYAPVSIAPLVFGKNELDRRPDFHVFLDRILRNRQPS
jgi:hypothetical protein